jgi:quinol monooxygenase YgiN
MSAVSEAEEGCISYQFYSSLEDDNLFLLFEQWETADALAKHLAQPHTRQFGAQFPGFLAGALDIKRYEVSAVSDL